MATHSSTVAQKIPWMEELGRLQSMGSLRVRHDWATSLSLSTFMHWRRKWWPTPVFLPGASQGRRSLAGRRLWGRTELDTTEATQQQQQQQQQYNKGWKYLCIWCIWCFVSDVFLDLDIFYLLWFYHSLKLMASPTPASSRSYAGSRVVFSDYIPESPLVCDSYLALSWFWWPWWVWRISIW